MEKKDQKQGISQRDFASVRRLLDSSFVLGRHKLRGPSCCFNLQFLPPLPTGAHTHTPKEKFVRRKVETQEKSEEERRKGGGRKKGRKRKLLLLWMVVVRPFKVAIFFFPAFTNWSSVSQVLRSFGGFPLLGSDPFFWRRFFTFCSFPRL